jgi:hypothetical protein
MRLPKVLIILTALFIAINAYSQNDTNKYRQIHFVKLNQANDLFTYWFQSDREYSDGVNIEVAHRIFNNKVANFCLIGFKNTIYKDFSLAISQDMYTPKNTGTDTVIYNDRPYAAQLYFTYAKYTNDFWRGRKLKARAFIGVQGPIAFGEQAQNKVHRWIDNPTANGWEHQLSNGLVLDYELQYMQQIPLVSHITEIHGFARARVGALYNAAEVGFRFKIGHYTDSYTNFYGIVNPKFKYNFTVSDLAKLSASRKKIIPKRIRKKSEQEQVTYLNNKLNRKFQFYFFTEGMFNYMLRDGSVEGSLIQFEDNVHSYSFDDYDHTNFIARYGFVLQYKGFYMEYMRYFKNDVFELYPVFGYGRIIFSWVF